MRLHVEHELPRRLRYAKVYMQLANAALFFSLDGSNASVYGSIGKSKTKPISLSDADYSRLRAASRVVEVIDHDGDKVIVENEDGYEEEWVRPRWVLVGIRKARSSSHRHPDNRDD